MQIAVGGCLVEAQRDLLFEQFPHLDVAGNVAFGLKYQKCTKEESRKRVAEVLVDVPDEEAHAICELNARKILRWDA